MDGKAWSRVHGLRRCVQWAVLLSLGVLSWANMHGWTRIYGSFFALDVYGLPFADPLSVVQPLVQGAFGAAALWVGAGLSLGIALVFGRVFCGWICPYGLLSEYMWLVGKGRTGYKGKGGETLRLWWRSVVLLVLMGFSAYGAVPLLQILSFPGGLSLVPLTLWYGDPTLAGVGLLVAVPGLVLLVELVVGRRLWCAYVCPQSVLLAWTAVMGKKFWGLRWNPKVCACKPDAQGRRPCEGACSLALHMRQKGGPPRGECTHCTDCVGACRAEGQGALSVGRRSTKNDLHSA
ncbi:MAG: 4Fe-4S binding protein [Desulfovibrionaceae bacterium]